MFEGTWLFDYIRVFIVCTLVAMNNFCFSFFRLIWMLKHFSSAAKGKQNVLKRSS